MSLEGQTTNDSWWSKLFYRDYHGPRVAWYKPWEWSKEKFYRAHRAAGHTHETASLLCELKPYQFPAKEQVIHQQLRRDGWTYETNPKSGKRAFEETVREFTSKKFIKRHARLLAERKANGPRMISYQIAGTGVAVLVLLILAPMIINSVVGKAQSLKQSASDLRDAFVDFEAEYAELPSGEPYFYGEYGVVEQNAITGLANRKVRIVVAKDGEDYVIQRSIRGNNVLSNVASSDEESRFAVGANNVVRAKVYTNQHMMANYSAQWEPNEVNVVSVGPDESSTKKTLKLSKKGPYLDPLSALFAVREDLIVGAVKDKYTVYDGENIYTFNAGYVGEEPVATPNQVYDSLMVKLVFPVSGQEKLYWFAPDLDYYPVRYTTRFTNSDGSQSVYEATLLNF